MSTLPRKQNFPEPQVGISVPSAVARPDPTAPRPTRCPPNFQSLGSWTPDHRRKDAGAIRAELCIVGAESYALKSLHVPWSVTSTGVLRKGDVCRQAHI